MTDILLAKPQLGDEWCDLSVGEATLVRNNLFKHFPSLQDPTFLMVGQGMKMEDFEYPAPAGIKELTDLLEEKHGAPVVIGNGAKQLLGNIFHCLHKRNRTNIALQPINWALLPPLMKMHGTRPIFVMSNELQVKSNNTAWLLLAPGNPDGCCSSYEELKDEHKRLSELGIPFIHDAAYYTASYLPDDYQLGPLGDVQIFSFSKMLGLSGIRGGYAVCYDKSFYHDMIEYQEMMTVGVSAFTQKFLYSVLKKMKANPETSKAFEKANYAELTKAKHILKKIPSKILEVSDDVEKVPGMFFWGKLLNKEAFIKAKIHIVGGEPFGDASKVRLNLGIGNEVLDECVKRLKEVML